MAAKRTPPQSTASDPVTAWAESVVAGEVVAGPHVRNACKRHLQDLVDGPARGLHWDADAALRAIEFFPDVLRLNGGQFEGEPFHLHPSQQFKTGSIFGWKRTDGTRRFRRAYIEEGKGNGKSPWAAGTGMYCLVADGEARAEVYAAAAKKDQAFILFRDAVAMREQSPALARRLVTSGSNPVWNLADPVSGSFFRPISREARKSGSGPRPSCVLTDEVHEHPDRRVIEMLERGFKWRRQPLLVMITNSGSDRNSVCWEQRQHAVRVAAGTRTPDDAGTYVGTEAVDDTTFSFVCGLDLGDDPEDPGCWAKANPLLGVTVTEEYLAGVLRQARDIPGSRNGILRLHFCVWTDAETSWVSREALEAVLADFDPGQHAGRPVHLGVDLSATKDLTAIAVVVPTGTVIVDRDGEDVALPTFDAWIEAFTPADTLAARAIADQAPYDVWVRDGWLNATPGQRIRLDFVAAKIAAIAGGYDVHELAYDRHTYDRLRLELDDLGVDVAEIEHPQGGRKRGKAPEDELKEAKLAGTEPTPGLWMPGSLIELEALILDGRIRLLRNPVLISACMSAATDHDDFGNRWLAKYKATNRIDPAVALCMAVGSATRRPAPKRAPDAAAMIG